MTGKRVVEDAESPQQQQTRAFSSLSTLEPDGSLSALAALSYAEGMESSFFVGPAAAYSLDFATGFSPSSLTFMSGNPHLRQVDFMSPTHAFGLLFLQQIPAEDSRYVWDWKRKSMLEGFGFDWITAPGEAEATLSAMTSSGIPCRIDAILTDDSDAFVFGAEIVLRIRSEDNDNYSASRYSAFDITQQLGLTRYDLILIALLAGGDYSDGVDGCGSPPLLTSGALSLRSELRTNASGKLQHRYPALAAKIPDNFPPLDIINLYLHPIIAERDTPISLALNSAKLDILARFAEAHFGWGDSIGILTHFADSLFAGLVVRVDNPSPSSLTLSSTVGAIVGNRAHKSTGFLAELRLVPEISPVVLTSALGAIHGERDPAGGAEAAVADWIKTRPPKNQGLGATRPWWSMFIPALCLIMYPLKPAYAPWSIFFVRGLPIQVSILSISRPNPY
ncbi:XPG I-region-domain-containing protein [Favolaschia claudopus]|uniref:XPG I-region-domain-containing protein n=1 Tax=Favolaschia claudopus TaxID=2862362 RepID=A0AAV9ZS07_9AGAR